tara:strand:- start:59103 stop:59414 length:312 start_codon:yes stop_codon:yes gene_type:complete
VSGPSDADRVGKPGLPAKVLLLLVFAIPVAFAGAVLLGNAAAGPNFAVLGVLGMVAALAMAIAGRIRTKRIQKPWLVALCANAVVVFVAAGLIDFSGFAGGGH